MIDTWIFKMPADAKEDTAITAETPYNIVGDAKSSYENRMQAYLQRFQHIAENLSKNSTKN